MRHQIIRGAFALAASLAPALVSAQETITLHGASQFNDDHAFTKAMVKFEELVKACYGKPVNFILHKNSSLGLEKQYFEYMSQGKAVDYAIVSPAHMSTFSRAAPFIDAPFLFRDLGHWDNVLQLDLLKPVADEVEKRARVMLIGYAGGGVRNIFAYNEIYNAIQNGVIDAGENEAAGVEQMRFFEVAPQLAMTQHAITIRPLCFSSQTFARLPNDLQAAIRRAGREAAVFGRQIESEEDESKLEALEKAGRLKRVEFAERAEMKRLVDPVMQDYAKEIDAEPILRRINAT